MYSLDVLLTVENLDLIVCDHLIKTVSLPRLKTSIRAGIGLALLLAILPHV